MQNHQIQVAHEDIERVDTLRYMWGKLQEQATTLQSKLLDLQPRYRLKLITNVELYQKEVKCFTRDYNQVNPLPPHSSIFNNVHNQLV